MEFSMIGVHNIQNALAAIATGIEMNISIEKIKKTLTTFTGVQRRFQTVGFFKNTTIIDDYGHWKGSKKAVDEYLDKNNINVFLHRIDYTARLFVKP